MPTSQCLDECSSIIKDAAACKLFYRPLLLGKMPIARQAAANAYSEGLHFLKERLLSIRVMSLF